jgi:uncharacterized protein YehS (DUF1456 family)
MRQIAEKLKLEVSQLSVQERALSNQIILKKLCVPLRLKTLRINALLY